MLDFPGVQLALSEEAAIITSTVPLHTLSSAVVGGGFLHTRTIMNRHVDITYHCDDPASDLTRFAYSREIEPPFVGLLTGVWIRETQVVTLHEQGIMVACILTAGVRNATAAGSSPPARIDVGTINIVLLIDARLAPAAMVNAVITATEAKTAVLADCGILTPEGERATGTSTDAIVIACTERGPELPYAGPITVVGYLIGAAVRACLTQALIERGDRER